VCVRDTALCTQIVLVCTPARLHFKGFFRIEVTVQATYYEYLVKMDSISALWEMQMCTCTCRRHVSCRQAAVRLRAKTTSARLSSVLLLLSTSTVQCPNIFVFRCCLPKAVIYLYNIMDCFSFLFFGACMQQVSRGIDLVYGGGSLGLMGLVSHAVHRGGRRVLGYSSVDPDRSSCL